MHFIVNSKPPHEQNSSPTTTTNQNTYKRSQPPTPSHSCDELGLEMMCSPMHRVSPGVVNKPCPV